MSTARNLKNNSRFQGIYINKDLTYEQREELRARRELNQNRQYPLESPNDLVIPSTGSNATPIGVQQQNL